MLENECKSSQMLPWRFCMVDSNRNICVLEVFAQYLTQCSYENKKHLEKYALDTAWGLNEHLLFLSPVSCTLNRHISICVICISTLVYLNKTGKQKEDKSRNRRGRDPVSLGYVIRGIDQACWFLLALLVCQFGEIWAMEWLESTNTHTGLLLLWVCFVCIAWA